MHVATDRLNTVCFELRCIGKCFKVNLWSPTKLYFFIRALLLQRSNVSGISMPFPPPLKAVMISQMGMLQFNWLQTDNLSLKTWHLKET